VDRRAFLGTVAGGLLAGPLAAEAQQPGKVWRIGALYQELPTTTTARGAELKGAGRSAMGFDGYDFIIIGLVLGTGSALLLAKAYLMPSFPLETAATYLGQNPFQVRNTIITRHEAIAGCVWLVLGLVAALIGTVRSVRSQQQGYLVSAWYDILVLLAAAAVVLRLTVAVTNRTSRAEYAPILSSSMREVYNVRAYPLFHDGRSRDQVTLGAKADAGSVERRMREGHEAVEQIGKLLDEPRLPDEDDRAYARRLGRYFEGINLD
jgi:hypothetical protein